MSAEESVDQAYGYSIGEEVTYKGFLRAKIRGFKLNNIASVVLWDAGAQDWASQPMDVSVNDCE